MNTEMRDTYIVSKTTIQC